MSQGIDVKTYEAALASAYARGHAKGMEDMSDLLAGGTSEEQARRALLAASEAAGKAVLTHAATQVPAEVAPVLRALAGLLP